MPYPSAANVVVLWGSWFDESTRSGMDATLTATPLPAGTSTGTATPNLTASASWAWIKSRQWHTKPLASGLYALPLLANDDPDLTAFGGYRIDAQGETPFICNVSVTAATTTVTQEMADAIAMAASLSGSSFSVPVGSTVQAVHLTDAAVLSGPQPSPPTAFYTMAQTNSVIAAALASIPVGGSLIPTSIFTTGTHVPANGELARYNPAGAATPANISATLPAASANQRFGVVNTSVASSSYTATFTCAGSDTFSDATTTLTLKAGERAVLVGAPGGFTVESRTVLSGGSTFTQTATAKTAAYTAAANEIVVVDTSGGMFTVTGPTSGAPFGLRWKAGTVAPTVAAPSGYTINGAASVTPSLPPGTSSGELTTWQAFGTDYQVIGRAIPPSVLDGRYRAKLDLASSGAKGAVCFTYDDCNASMLTCANMAAARGQRNTFFITSDQISGGLKLSSAQIAAIAAQGHELGAHSKTHPDVSAIATAAGRAVEYDTPRTVVEGIVGVGKVTSWAYPGGARSVTTDTELYLRYDRIFGVGYTSGNCVVPMADRNNRFLVGRWSWGSSANSHGTVLDLIRLAAREPVVVVIYTHDPGNASGAFPNDPSFAQVAEAYDLAASLGVPSVGIAEALPASNLVVNPGFEDSSGAGVVPPGWTVPVVGSSAVAESVAVTPSIGLNGTNSMHIGASSAASSLMTVEQAIPVVPNSSYKWSFRSQVANLTAGQFQYNMKQLDYAGMTVLDTVGAITANEAWNQRSRTLTTAANTMTILLAYQILGNTIGDWYIDHVDMRPTQFGSFG